MSALRQVKCYGNSYTQQTEDGKHIKMVWIDYRKNPDLVGPEKPFHFPQYIKVSELIRFKENAYAIVQITNMLNAVKKWVKESDSPTSRCKVQGCVVPKHKPGRPKKVSTLPLVIEIENS